MLYKLYKYGETTPVASIEIATPPVGTTYYDIQWDSKTGIVSALVATPNMPIPEKRTPIHYTGTGCVSLEPDYYYSKFGNDLSAGEGAIQGMNYHYWYY